MVRCMVTFLGSYMDEILATRIMTLTFSRGKAMDDRTKRRIARLKCGNPIDSQRDDTLRFTKTSEKARVHVFHNLEKHAHSVCFLNNKLAVSLFNKFLTLIRF